MPIVETVLYLAIAAVCFVLAFLLIKQQKISLIHSYHHQWVKQENVKAFTRLHGKALLVLGIGLVVLALVNFLTGTFWGWLAFVLGLTGFSFWRGQRKSATTDAENKLIVQRNRRPGRSSGAAVICLREGAPFTRRGSPR